MRAAIEVAGIQDALDWNRLFKVEESIESSEQGSDW
jgi:hypothetical protein